MSELQRAELLFVFVGALTACGGKQDGVATTSFGGASSVTTGGTSLHPSDPGGGGPARGTSSTGGSSFKVASTATGIATGGTSISGTTGGTTSVGGGASGGTQAVLVFTASYVTPYCTRLAQCCVQAGYSAPSATACQATELGYYQAALANGSAQVNSAAISTLLSSIQNTCDQPSYTLFSDLTTGTWPMGSDCTDVSQCQGDSVACIVPVSASTGKCVPLTRGKVGDSCAVDCDTTSSCQWTINGGTLTESAACWDEDGLRCDSTTNQCVALARPGASCDFSVDCGVHASCMNSVCVAKANVGESCSNGRSCESTLTCNSNSTCEKMSIAYSGSCG